MASKPYMQFYISDYLNDTQHLSTLEHGAYLLLIMNYFQTGKPFQDNDRKLSRICKLTLSKFSKLKPALMEFFSLIDGFWVHKRIEIELEKLGQKSSAAKLAAQILWAKKKEQERMRTHSERIANAMPTHSECNAIRSDTDTDTDTKHTPLNPPKGDLSTIDKKTELINFIDGKFPGTRYFSNTATNYIAMMNEFVTEGVETVDIENHILWMIENSCMGKPITYYKNDVISQARFRHTPIGTPLPRMAAGQRKVVSERLGLDISEKPKNGKYETLSERNQKVKEAFLKKLKENPRDE